MAHEIAPNNLQIQSLRLLKAPRAYRFVATWLLVLVSLIILALIFVPWQQTVVGKGEVSVFSPMERPQTVEAQIPGRLVKWYVQEGQQVKEGERIALISDLDPKFLGENQLQLLENQKQALITRQSATMNRIQALSQQLNALTTSQQGALPAAGERASQSLDRLEAAQQALTAARQNLETTRFNFDRIEQLYTKGLRSKRDFELAELERVRAQTEVERAQAALQVARRDIQIAQFDQTKIAGDTEASLASVSSSIASAQETLATTNSDLAKLEVDIQNLQQRIAQQDIRAPRKGRVVRLMKVGPGQTVAGGDILATVVPETTDQSVELYVSDWDAPLISPGRRVRIQFSGFPALQFAGWPSIAVGTFAGRVAVIDAVANEQGRYRVLVRPDYAAIQSRKEDPWPSPEYLRPGTAASGWFLLDTVPLGYELWRQFNAFPPTVLKQEFAADQAEQVEKMEQPPKRKKTK